MTTFNAENIRVVGEGAVPFTVEQAAEFLTRYSPESFMEELVVVSPDSVYRLPQHRDLLLRYKHPVDAQLPTDPDEAYRQILWGENEFSRLGEMGLRLTPPCTTFVAPNEAGKPPTVLSVVPRHGDGKTLAEDLGDPEKQELQLNIIRILLNYHQQAEGRYLGELPYPGQYAQDGTLYSHNWLLYGTTQRKFSASCLYNWVDDLRPSKEQRTLQDETEAFQQMIPED